MPDFCGTKSGTVLCMIHIMCPSVSQSLTSTSSPFINFPSQNNFIYDLPFLMACSGGQLLRPWTFENEKGQDLGERCSPPSPSTAKHSSTPQPSPCGETKTTPRQSLSVPNVPKRTPIRLRSSPAPGHPPFASTPLTGPYWLYWVLATAGHHVDH